MNEYVAKFIEIRESLEQEKIRLESKMSEVDGKLQDILHFVEFGRYNAPDGARLLKELKRLRKERRDLKEEYSSIHSAYDKVKGVKFKEESHTEKTYTFRSDVVKNVIGRQQF